MKHALSAIALFVAGCATAATEPAPSSGSCRAEGLQALVGQEASAALGADALRRSGARRLRWIRPGDVVTMDYSPQRLNVHLDAANRVERFACG